MTWDIYLQWGIFSLTFPFALYLLLRTWWEEDAPEVYTEREEEERKYKDTGIIYKLDKDDY